MEDPSTLATGAHHEGKTRSEDSACQKDQSTRKNNASDAVRGPCVPANTNKAYTAEVTRDVTRQTGTAFTIQHILRHRQLQTLPPSALLETATPHAEPVVLSIGNPAADMCGLVADLHQHAGVPAKTENLPQPLN
ncbi:hypothetical protein Emag_002704 [Eimeria magna]